MMNFYYFNVYYWNDYLARECKINIKIRSKSLNNAWQAVAVLSYAKYQEKLEGIYLDKIEEDSESKGVRS